MTTGLQIRKARALLCWSRSDFSRLTALAVWVLDRAEATDTESSVTRSRLIAIRHARTKAGIEFTAHASGVRLRGPGPT